MNKKGWKENINYSQIRVQLYEIQFSMWQDPNFKFKSTEGSEWRHIDNTYKAFKDG